MFPIELVLKAVGLIGELNRVICGTVLMGTPDFQHGFSNQTHPSDPMMLGRGGAMRDYLHSAID